MVPDTPPEEELTEEASTTEPEVVVVATTTESSVSVNTLTNDNNIFSFSKSECVGVGDGSFYCTNATTSPLVAGMDRVFSAPDSDGDKEIYIEKGGVLTQITSNQLDDDAPHYDESSNSIVWHRLVNERYQIISYDVAEALEEQITNDRYNNMEPSRYGDITVWQGWVGNDWEIMLMEGDDISMITDNTTGDVSPRINGNYIIWQAFEDTAWRVKVYDRDTKEIDTIADADGASVDNPRLVLVYDTKHENGDVEVKGYDLETGKVTPLSASPAPIPEKIPDPEQTGEERALVQTNTQIKTKTDADTDTEPNPDESTATTSLPILAEDVIVPPFVESDEAGTTTEDTTEEVVPDVLPDVVILPSEIESASSTDHIIDVIITPYVEPILPVVTEEDIQ